MYRIMIVLLGLFISTITYADDNQNNTTPPKSPDPSIHSYKLPNGLQLIVKVDKRAPVLISEVWYRVGGSYEPNGITGISHMLEHMMFQGTDKYPKGVFFRMIDENGGQMNAMTSRDFTMYYEKLANDKLPLSFKLESDRMRHLSLDDKAFQKERQVVLNERHMRTDNSPQATTAERFNAAAYLGNPYHHPVVGWESDIKNYTIEDLRNWYKIWYAPNNAIVVVVGDVEPQKVYELANQYFGPLKPQPLPPVKPHPIVKPLGQRLVNVSMPAKLPFLLMGYNTPSHASNPKDWEPYALEVLASVLGDGGSSRLAKNLVRGSEVASSADASYSLYSRLPSMFMIAGIPSQGHDVQQLKQAIIKQIDLLQNKPISEKELDRVKTRLISSKTYSRDSISTQAFLIGSLAVINLPWEESLNYYKQIQKVTPEQVQAVAKKYLQPKRATVAILHPKNVKSQAKQPSNKPVRG